MGGEGVDVSFHHDLGISGNEIINLVDGVTVTFDLGVNPFIFFVVFNYRYFHGFILLQKLENA